MKFALLYYILTQLLPTSVSPNQFQIKNRSILMIMVCFYLNFFVLFANQLSLRKKKKQKNRTHKYQKQRQF